MIRLKWDDSDAHSYKLVGGSWSTNHSNLGDCNTLSCERQVQTDLCNYDVCVELTSYSSKLSKFKQRVTPPVAFNITIKPDRYVTTDLDGCDFSGIDATVVQWRCQVKYDELYTKPRKAIYYYNICDAYVGGLSEHKVTMGLPELMHGVDSAEDFITPEVISFVYALINHLEDCIKTSIRAVIN